MKDVRRRPLGGHKMSATEEYATLGYAGQGGQIRGTTRGSHPPTARTSVKSARRKGFKLL